MMQILEKIVNNRRQLLEKEKQSVSVKEIKENVDIIMEKGYVPLNFLRDHTPEKSFLVAEIKKASPSKGLIRKDFDVCKIASVYKDSQYINAISVLTEPEFFLGSYDYLRDAVETANKPVLMKDFVVDEYQLYRGFLEGASAALLIAAVLDDNEVSKLTRIARDLKMTILFETHTAVEYRRAMDFNFALIGINNRDLNTFVTDIHTTVKIIDAAGKPEDKVVISESGINSRDDIRVLRNGGADGFLIGERFMREDDIESVVSDLFGEGNGQAAG